MEALKKCLAVSSPHQNCSDEPLTFKTYEISNYLILMFASLMILDQPAASV